MMGCVEPVYSTMAASFMTFGRPYNCVSVCCKQKICNGCLYWCSARLLCRFLFFHDVNNNKTKWTRTFGEFPKKVMVHPTTNFRLPQLHILKITSSLFQTITLFRSTFIWGISFDVHFPKSSIPTASSTSFFCDTPRIVCGQFYRQFVIYIWPLGVMIHFFSKQGNAGHESKCYAKNL